jgi:hypothetical protein
MVCATRRVAGDAGVLVRIRRVVIAIDRDNSCSDRYISGDDLIDKSSSTDDHNVDTSIDNRLADHHVDQYLDDDHRGSVVGHRNSRHRPIGAGSRHHRVSHG